MKRKIFAIFLVALLLLAAGCGAGSSVSWSTAPGEPGAATESGGNWSMDAGGGEDFSLGAPESQGPYPGSSVYQNAGAKLIRRAELSVQTEQFDQSVEALNRLVADCGGYFENASVYGGGRRDAYADRWGEYTVRVPAENYDRFLSGTGGLGYVTSRNESSQDVGEEYFDTEARLKTQQAKHERLLALLEKAETMEDIIALESALSEVEYQMEQYSSQLNRYDALIGFSTFTISLDEVSKVTQEVGETASLGARMAAGFQDSLRNLGEGFQNFLVWVSYNVFLLAVLAAAAVVAVTVGRRKIKKYKKEKSSGTEE